MIFEECEPDENPIDLLMISGSCNNGDWVASYCEVCHKPTVFKFFEKGSPNLDDRLICRKCRNKED